MNNERNKKETELAEWLIDQYIEMRMGSLEDYKVESLNEAAPGWDISAAEQIIAGVFGRIVYDNFQKEIDNDIPASWDIVVQTVKRKIKNDIRKFGHGVVVK